MCLSNFNFYCTCTIGHALKTQQFHVCYERCLSHGGCLSHVIAFTSYPHFWRGLFTEQAFVQHRSNRCSGIIREHKGGPPFHNTSSNISLYFINLTIWQMGLFSATKSFLQLSLWRLNNIFRQFVRYFFTTTTGGVCWKRLDWSGF